MVGHKQFRKLYNSYYLLTTTESSDPHARHVSLRPSPLHQIIVHDLIFNKNRKSSVRISNLSNDEARWLARWRYFYPSMTNSLLAAGD